MSISKQYRPVSGQFQEVFTSGKKIQTEYFRFFFKKADHPVLGISIRKKDYQRAVDRHAVKRRLKSWYGAHLQSFESYALIVAVKSGLPVRDKEAMQRVLEHAFDHVLRSLLRAV